MIATKQHLTQLETTGLIRLAQTQPEFEYLFRHVLVQDAAYRSLLRQDRRRLHQQVAETLERLYPDRLDELAAVLGHHFWLAGDNERALNYFIMAGDGAARIYANAEAIGHYNRALEIVATDVSQPETTQLYRARGKVYEILGDFEQAQTDYQTTLNLTRTHANQLDEWQALIDLGFLWASRDYVETGQYFQQALDLARQIDNDTNLAHSLNWMGNWHLNVEEPLRARQYHEEALIIFERLNDERGLAETYDLLGMTNGLGNDLISSKRYYDQAIDSFRHLDDRQRLSSSLATLILCAPILQTNLVVPVITLAEGVRQGQMAVQLAREIGWRAGEAYALALLGYALGPESDYDWALRTARAGLQIAEDIEHLQWMALAHCALGELHLDILNVSTAEQHLEQALALANKVDSGHWRHTATGCLASAYVLHGQLDRAETVLKAVTLPDAPGQTLGQRKCWAALAELALDTNNPEGALSIVERMIAAVTDISPDGCVPRLWILHGRALAMLDRFDEAEAALQAAKTEATVQGVSSMLWRVHLALAELYQSQDRQEAAQSELETAQEIIQKLAANISDETLRDDFLQRAAMMNK